jgi:hypothetical protein
VSKQINYAGPKRFSKKTESKLDGPQPGDHVVFQTSVLRNAQGEMTDKDALLESLIAAHGRDGARA